MSHPLEQLRDEALRGIGSAPDEQALESVRVKYLGKSGSVSAWGEQMKMLARRRSRSSVNCSTTFAMSSPRQSKRVHNNFDRKENRVRSRKSTSRFPERRGTLAHCIR